MVEKLMAEKTLVQAKMMSTGCKKMPAGREKKGKGLADVRKWHGDQVGGMAVRLHEGSPW